ncbi:MAG TPA: SIR2 family protein [Candidatus Eisenbacteria bacterium]|nr:SIR2 family protein [Candidatus Eisenbacteria bacterium]
MSVTAFIGAGAVLNIGGPTTSRLTDAVKLRDQWDGIPNSNVRVPAIQQIGTALDTYFRTSANFEDIFHAVESLISLRAGLTPTSSKEFKPAIGAFVTPTTAANHSDIVLIQASDDIIDEVANHIVQYVNGFDPNTAHRWFADFWRNATAACHWDIGTLNYDNCVEQSLTPGSWEDGFVNLDPGISRFVPAQIVNSAITRILHLHGSVFYGYPRFPGPNRFIFEDQFEDLYRYDSLTDAKPTWFGRSRNQSQSGDRATAGPIITGQRKPDKLLAYPYSTYQTVLHDVLLNNPRLLIAGYGFGDLHFNRFLSRLTRLHGDNRRVVIIDFVPPRMRPPDWIPDYTMRGWPSSGMFKTLVQLSRETTPLDGRYRNPWVSLDGRCKVYLDEFQDTVQNHGADISNFLST